MKTVAFIFARGGSKGLPGKNIKTLGGIPLVAWSIKIAKQVNRINRIIVSTDDRDIANTALKYGAEVPFLRPANLATDQCPEILAWKHALEYLEKVENYKTDVMISLPATSPLRTARDVDKCIDLYLSGSVDGIITVSESSRNPYFNMISREIDGSSKVVCKTNKNIFRRQDAPKVYDMNTVCFTVNPSFIMTTNSLMAGKLKSVIIPRERSIDIDDLLDFKMAELLIQNHEIN